MGFVSGVNQYRVIWDFTVGVEGLSYGIYVLDENPGVGDRLGDLLTVVDDFQINDNMPVISADLLYNGVTAYDMSSATAPTRSIQHIPAVAGGVGAPISPTNGAMVISMRSAGRGRSSRGRLYYVGLGEVSLTEDEWAAASAAATQALFEGLQTDLNTADFELIVSSSIFEGAERATRLAQPVTAIEAKVKLGTQRRRVRYGDGR